MALTSDCQTRGRPDWGAQAPAESPACGEGEQAGGADWGETAAYDPPWTPDGGLVGHPDGGAFSSYDPEWTPDGGLVGYPDWGEWASYDPDWTLDGALVGFPDWGENAQNEGLTMAQADLELAARRNWIFSRFASGQVFFYDDFEAANIHWELKSGGGGTAPAIDTSRANSGEQSVALVVNSNVNAYSSISRELNLPRVTRFGVGVFYAADVGIERLSVETNIVKDEIGHTVSYRYNLLTGELEYFTDGAVWETVGTLNTIVGTVQSFGFFHMVADIDTDKYERIILGSELISMDATCRTFAQVGKPDMIDVTVRYTSIASTGGTAYVDDLVMTMNEV